MEKVVLYREESQGPAAQLCAFRGRPQKGVTPYDVNRPKNARVGTATPGRKG